jgi:hypothetical protein
MYKTNDLYLRMDRLRAKRIERAVELKDDPELTKISG